MGFDPRWADIEAAGGLHIIPPQMGDNEVRREIAGGSIRAVEAHIPDLSPLLDFPIEFLMTTWPDVDATPINRLTRLRGLSLDSWSGDLSVSLLPDLEWFGVIEAEPGQLDDLFDSGHPKLLSLSVGRYREQDLSPLHALNGLVSLAIVNSRSLETLEGIGNLDGLAHLDLTTCPRLASLRGLETAPRLRAVTLESCNRIDDLSPLAGLPNLRVVQIEMRETPSLAPLNGHPRLEFLWIVGREPRAEEIETLLETTSIRMINAGRSSWLRMDEGWKHFANLYAMSDRELQLRDELITELNAAKYQ